MYTLVDAKKQNEEAPDTFKIPSKEDISKLQVGSYAQLGFEEEGTMTERMWIMIESINGSSFIGMLDNEPIGIKSVEIGDEVKFDSKNILKVLI